MSLTIVSIEPHGEKDRHTYFHSAQSFVFISFHIVHESSPKPFAKPTFLPQDYHILKSSHWRIYDTFFISNDSKSLTLLY